MPNGPKGSWSPIIYLNGGGGIGGTGYQALGGVGSGGTGAPARTWSLPVETDDTVPSTGVLFNYDTSYNDLDTSWFVTGDTFLSRQKPWIIE